jgi:hypothetical protein
VVLLKRKRRLSRVKKDGKRKKKTRRKNWWGPFLNKWGMLYKSRGHTCKRTRDNPLMNVITSNLYKGVWIGINFSWMHENIALPLKRKKDLHSLFHISSAKSKYVGTSCAIRKGKHHLTLLLQTKAFRITIQSGWPERQRIEMCFKSYQDQQ